MFNGIIQTILVAISMKTSWACIGILSSENDDFKFLKTTKNRKSTCIMCTIVPGLVEVFISPKQSVVDQKHERKSSHGCIIYFPKYQFLDTGHFSLTLSIQNMAVLSIIGRVHFKLSGYFGDLFHFHSNSKRTFYKHSEDRDKGLRPINAWVMCLMNQHLPF